MVHESEIIEAYCFNISKIVVTLTDSFQNKFWIMHGIQNVDSSFKIADVCVWGVGRGIWLKQCKTINYVNKL